MTFFPLTHHYQRKQTEIAMTNCCLMLRFVCVLYQLNILIMRNSQDISLLPVGIPSADQDYSIVSDSQSEYFSDRNPHNSKERRKRLNKLNKKKKSQREGIWSFEENFKYMKFLKENLSLFELNTNSRKLIKINVQISKFLKSRTPDQCRSHHQKMLKSHKTPLRIVEYFERLSRRFEAQLIQNAPKQSQVMPMEPEQQVSENLLPETVTLSQLYEIEQVPSNDPMDIFDEIFTLHDGQIWLEL